MSPKNTIVNWSTMTNEDWTEQSITLIEKFDGEMGDSGDSTKTVDSSKSLKQNDVAPMGE